MKFSFRFALAAWSIAFASIDCSAATIGQLDEFNGDVAGWRVSGGGSMVNGPIVIPTGGPDAGTDPYLQYTTDTVNTGGRFLIINSEQWSGDYLSSGVTGIEAMARNEGDIDLHLRLLLEGPGGLWLSQQATVLPVGGTWQPVTFPISAADLTGGTDLSSTISAVSQIRIFHNPQASFPGPKAEATLGIDNITAVPEPSHGLMALCLFAMLLRLADGRKPAITQSRPLK